MKRSAHATHVRTAFAILRLMRPLQRGLQRRLERQHVTKAIHTSTREILDLVQEVGPVTVPFLSRALILERQPVQRSVDTLVKARLLCRMPNPDHRRSPFLALTRTGEVELERIRASESLQLRPMIEPLPVALLKQCLVVLEHLRIELGMDRAVAASQAQARAHPRFSNENGATNSSRARR